MDIIYQKPTNVILNTQKTDVTFDKLTPGKCTGMSVGQFKSWQDAGYPWVRSIHGDYWPLNFFAHDISDYREELKATLERLGMTFEDLTVLEQGPGNEEYENTLMRFGLSQDEAVKFLKAMGCLRVPDQSAVIQFIEDYHRDQERLFEEYCRKQEQK